MCRPVSFGVARDVRAFLSPLTTVTVKYARHWTKLIAATFKMQQPIYYSRTEYIETVCIGYQTLLAVVTRAGSHGIYLHCLIRSGHGKQGISQSDYCWTTKHHPWRENDHFKWCDHQG